LEKGNGVRQFFYFEKLTDEKKRAQAGRQPI